MKKLLWTLLLLPILICNGQIKNDSLKKTENIKVTDNLKPQELVIKVETKAEKDNTFLNLTVTILVAIFGGGVSYLIYYQTQRSKKKELKLETLKTKKAKLEQLKSEVFTRAIDISDKSNLTVDSIRSKYIDRLQTDISSVIANGDLFEKPFIDSLNSFSSRLSQNIINHNIKNQSTNSTPTQQEIEDFENIPVVDSKIRNEITNQIQLIENEINLFLK